MKTGKIRLPLRKVWEKARVFLPGALLAILFCVCTSLFPSQVTYQMRGEEVETSYAPARETREREEAETEGLRILREHDGGIGVFFTDGTLERVVAIDVFSLPAYDRELLAGGIVTSGEEELSELLESLRS